MKLKSFLKILKDSGMPYNRNVVEYFRFVIVDPYLKCSIRIINKKRILWSVRYLGEKNEVHPNGKWQLKSGEGIFEMYIYLKRYRGVDLIA